MPADRSGSSPVAVLRPCAYCYQPAEGNYSIHRDGFGVGPEVDLCDAHGGGESPTCGEIWARIARHCEGRRCPVSPGNTLACRCPCDGCCHARGESSSAATTGVAPKGTC